MYSRYANNLYSRDRYHRYPSYGYYDDSFVDYRQPYSWYDYWYGGGRRYPNYWEADDFSRYRRRRREPSDDRSRPEPPEEILTKGLKCEEINLHVKQNAKKHKTGRYECVREKGQCVVRRGDTMKVTFTFDRKYNIEKNDAKIQFSIGENPSQPKGTKVIFTLIETKKKEFQPDEWGAKLEENFENKLTIQVHIPVNCIVGRWNMVIKTFVDGKDENGEDKLIVLNKECDQDIIILFNPWSKDDTVSMIPKGPLKEYILSDDGFIFVGYWKWPSARPWSFAQFDEGILEAALYLLNAGFGGRPSKTMSDPIQVGRILAKMVNVQDDRGILVGNWSGDYADGTSPTKWVGSGPIIKQFMENKEPVKYGQCWVYSALLTTVCRALGIPCRSVTCFASAHDTDYSATIDKFFDTNDEPIEWMNSDSIWNFHVWNEIWIARHDLEEKGWNGWNVIDATPQELSDGVYTCGPSPVAAIKRGRCDVPYDTIFVYSEVNAEEVDWTRLPNGDLKRKKVETDGVGKSLYTKNPEYDEDNPNSSKKGLNIVHEYKYPEKSDEERKAALMAHKTARLRRDVYTTKPEEGEIEFQLVFADSRMIGDDLEITFTARHVGDYIRTVNKPFITVSPKLYTGTVGKSFFRKDFDDFEMKPKDEKRMSVTLNASDYYKHLVEGAYIYIVAACHVPKYDSRGRTRPQQTFYKGQDFKFEKPTLEIKGPKKGTLDNYMEFQVTFKNPLDIPLTGCSMDIVSKGFETLRDIPQKDVPAGDKYQQAFTLTAVRAGSKHHTIMFSFECKELVDMTGEHRVLITNDEEDTEDD